MIFPDALPKIKTFLRPACPSQATRILLVAMIAGFLAHPARMSASCAAESIRTQARHRAAIVRFLARLHWSRDWTLLTAVAGLVLEQEHRLDGTWVFILDQTYVGQQGYHTENTFSRANTKKRQRKGDRHNKRSHRRSCHGFVMGLLITPSGLRIPSCRSYYTEAYCREKSKEYRTQPQLAAELIAAVAVPEGASVVVLGDTAFEAKDIRVACAARRFGWVVPVNPSRVLAGDTPRPQVKSLSQGLSAEHFAAVRLVPGQGAYAAQRRAARCRVGPKAKARTYYVHPERRAVHNVGEVLLVFSTTQQPQEGHAVRVQKVLMTDLVGREAADVVALYDLRWQIELFFKEVKGTLGLHRYRFRRFVKAENWVQVCLVAFVYLEWYRALQRGRRDLSEEDKRWWSWQRSYGLGRALMQRAEESDLAHLYRLSGTPTGRKKLRRSLREALPLEYRHTA